MSKRVTTMTDIKDKRFAILALKQVGLAFEEVSSTMLRIKSGSLVASLDLTTGDITSDAMDRNLPTDVIGELRKAYTEAKFRHDAAKVGVQIKQRLERKDGSVILKCRMASRG
jgi:hypothetical protein